MGMRRVLCTIASICLLFTLIGAGFRSKKAIEEEKPSVTSLINSLEKNQDVTDLLWVRCRLELMCAYEAEDIDFNARKAKSKYGNDINWNSRSTSKLDAKKLFKVLHPKVKHCFLDCLRKKKLTFLISEEEKPSEKWYSRFLDSIYTRPDVSGRRELIQDFAGAPTPSPSAGSAAPLPSSRTIPESQSNIPPSPPFFPRYISDPPPKATISEKPSVKNSKKKKKKKANKETTILIAVLATALSTFIVSALLFLCFCRACGKGSVRRNDESPLLSLRLSEYSAASSSHKSFGLNNEKPSNQSIDTILNHNKVAGDTYLDANMGIPIGTVAGIVTTMENSAPLNSGIAGMPPLKPPPGRAISSITTIGSGKGAGANSSIPTLSPGKGAPAPPPPPRPPPASAPPPPPPPRTSGGPRPPVSGAPPPPPAPSTLKPGPRPPPPPIGGVPPPRPPPMGGKSARPSPPAPTEGDDDSRKTKLKPFFWDKVMASPDQTMVWHQLKAGSFQFNEEMIETLFGYAPPDKNYNKSKDSKSQDPSNQYIQIIDAKKSHNLAILLKALNVTTEEVRDAIQEGNELPPELIQTLLKMAPTTDEELKLRLFNGDISLLGTAERFLKALVDIPFAFRRLECLRFMCALQEEKTMVKDSFVNLEAACTELRKSRLFLKLLEAVLKTGNRMNDGTFRGGAQAFKLDTLLKLSDVKGKDGKTTLLHFVVQEIIRSEGIRAARAAGASRSMSSIKSDDFLEEPSYENEEHYRSIGLDKVSGLSHELGNVKRAAVIDADSLTGTVARLGHALIKARDFLGSDMKNVDEEDGFHQTLRSFLKDAEVDIMRLLEEEKRIMALVKSTGDYFHGNSAKDEGLRLFVIVRDFLIILDKVCKEVKIHPPKTPRVQTPRKEDTTIAPSQSPGVQTSRKEGTAIAPSETPRAQTPRKEDTSAAPSETPRKEITTTAPSEPRPSPSPDPRQRLIPAIRERRVDSSSSSDDDDP